MSPRKLFISYSHADTALLAILRTHLKPLERNGVITPWFDGYLIPGDDIDARVRSALERAELVALLVSPDFLASDYCYDVEMRTAVARHQSGYARVVPIIVRECQWQAAPFGRLVAIPTDGKPIMSARWPDKDEAWTIVARGIEAAARFSPAARPGVELADAPKTLLAARPMQVVTTKRFSDKDRDDFRHSAFEHIARRFEASVGALGGDLAGTFRRVDANKFTATIYKSGRKVAGCTLWIGGGSLGGNSICYVSNDGGKTDSMSDWLSIDQNGDVLGLKPQMARARGRSDETLDSDGAAEHLWLEFVDRLKHD